MNRDLAAEIIERGEPKEILAMVFRARGAAEEGRWCECDEPITSGVGLLCGACLLNNQDQERLACVRIVRAHDFVPKETFLPMCAVCTMWEDNPRHHGVHGVGRASWGESIPVTPEWIDRLERALVAPRTSSGGNGDGDT